MHSVAQAHPELFSALPDAARELVEAAWDEASRGLSFENQRVLLDGAAGLLQAGCGIAVAVSYLRAAPQVLRAYGESSLACLLGVSVSVLRHAGTSALDSLFDSLPQALGRLPAAQQLHAYLGIIDELSEAAPDALIPLFVQSGRLLDQLALDGLRRWALLGVQSHGTDPDERHAWFRLESRDARAILRAAGEGVLFTAVERRLGFYLRALWARDTALRPATVSGEGRKGQRVSIVDGVIRMPRAFEVFLGQDGVALYRAAAAHAAAHLQFSAQRFALRALRPIQVALVSLIEDARAEHLAMREMPGLRALWLPFHVALPTVTFSAVSLMQRLSRALIDPGYHDENAFVARGRHMFAQALDQLEVPAISREIGALLGDDFGRMRVPFDFRTYVIEPLYRDDNLHLWDMGDAGEQRSDDQETILQSAKLEQQEGGEQSSAQTDEEQGGPAQPDTAQPDHVSASEAAVIEAALLQPYLYDEWDYLVGIDRPRWCTLIEKAAEPGDPRVIEEVLQRNDETVRRLTSMIRAVQMQRPQRLKKQLEGDRIDLDACIGATIDLRAGRVPDPRVHQRQGRNSRDLAVLVLLDLSQSTNDWVPAAGTTVLELAREATALVAHAMDDLGDNFAVHGFDSNGRHEIEYYRFKDFDQPYDELARARLAGMKGRLSTRMGTALRHAGHFLRQRRAAQRLILLLTDGEPHDIDVHDRQYLIFDTKRAVEDQRRHGIATFCLSLDPAADEYVTRIFGARNFMVLDHLRRLPEKLPALYLRLTS
ncbi:MAG: VWA domain-containing protein [Burkholderiales bacterium]|nr:VWA domain-containing protein [Burkholderiales bacterium]